MTATVTRATLRMKDLCEASGLKRQTIHFYIREGLLPPGHKTGRNMAYYSEDHLERIAVIRRLQDERFLPLRAIKAVLDPGASDDGFTPDQRAWLRDLKLRMSGALSNGAAGDDAPEEIGRAADRCGVPVEDVEALGDLGVLPIAEGAEGARTIRADDGWAVALLGELRAAGFTEEAGFAVADLAFYEELVTELFEREIDMLRDRLIRFDPSDAAAMVERVLPLVHGFITRYHDAKIRRFFAAME